MATFAEIIHAVKDFTRRGDGNSDDNPYSDRLVAFSINTNRALLIKQYKDKGRSISGNFIQTLGKVEIIKASKHECYNLDQDIGDCIYRIKNPMPSVIDTNSNNLITYVGTVDGLTSWQRTSFNKVQFDSYATYTGNRTKWYQINNYIYIVTKAKNLKYINIQGVFEAPEKANDYRECGEAFEDCFKGYDFEYPMNSSDIPTILKLMASNELAVANILPKDEVNDSRDTPITTR